MLDRLLKWGVDYLLKDYVIIDPNQAKTNILEGKIEFENLELRPDILQKVGIPGYSLRAGHISKLLVHISPWHYATEPGYVTIEGIYLLIVPSHAIKVDKQTKTERKVQDKLRTLAKIEDMRAQKLDDDSSDTQSKKESKDGFILRQVMAIVRNLQISISNIHIRLEDASTDPTCKVSLGLSLDSLTLNTCSSNWEERLVTESSDVFFKVAKLRSLAVYFTTHSKLYSEQAAAESKSLKGVLRATIAREGNKLPPAFHYILKPLSSDAKVWTVPNPKRCQSGQAQFFLDMVVHDVAIQASKQQVHCAIALAESTDLLRMKNKYKKFRPADFSSPSVKWKFALQCILVKIIRPKRDVWKWENIKWHRDTFKKYKAIMEKVYGNSNYKLTEVERIEKRVAEEKLDVFNLDLGRRLAQQAVKLTKEALAKEQKKKKEGGWFSSWYGSGSSESSKKAAAVEESVMLEIENSMQDTQNKAELYKALGVDDDSDDSLQGNYSLLPKDFIQLEFGVSLRKFSMNFVDTAVGEVVQSVCKVSVHQFKTSLWRQPVTNNVKVKVDLGKLDVEGSLKPDQDPKTCKAPTLVSMVEQNSRSSLATVVFELNPLGMPTVDFYIQVRSQAVQVIYDIFTVQSLVDYFQTKHEATLVAGDVKDAANRQMKKFNNTSAAGVMFLLEKHKVIFLDVDLEPSFALIPSMGTIDPNEPVVIFKSGHLKVVTKNKSHFGKSASFSVTPKSISRSSTFDELKEKPYDSFECTLSQVQLFYLHQSLNWQQIAFNPDSSESLVKPIKLTLDVHKCLVSDDPEFPVIKLNGALEDLNVIISDMTMIRLMTFLKEMKFPVTSTSSYVQPPVQSKTAPSLRYGKHSSAFDALDEIHQIDHLLPLESETGEKAKSRNDPETRQLTLVKLDYTIQRVAILLLEGGGGAKPTGVTNRLISAELKNLSINLLKKTYEIPVMLCLESVSVIHQRFNYDDAPLRLLETKTENSDESGSLVQIRIRIAERNSPIFHTEYESVEFLVEANIQSLRIRLHQEAILSAMAFQQNLTSRMFPETTETVQSLDTPEVEIDVQPSVESMEVIDRYNKMLARERKTKLVQLRLFASLKQTDVLVSSQKIEHDIAEMRLKCNLEVFILSCRIKKPNEFLLVSRFSEISLYHHANAPN